jgi:hypothetical protein
MEIFFHIGIYIPLLPALIATLKYRSLNKEQCWFAVLLWFIAINAILAQVWTLTIYSNNLPFFHVYILVEFIVLLIIFRAILETSLHHFVFIILLVGLPIAWGINLFFGEGWWGYPAKIHALEAILLSYLAVTWFAKLFRERKVKKLGQSFNFWFCTGIFMFYSSNILLFLFSSYIATQSSAVFDAIWGIHALLAILLYLIYAIAILWIRRTQKSS